MNYISVVFVVLVIVSMYFLGFRSHVTVFSVLVLGCCVECNCFSVVFCSVW